MRRISIPGSPSYWSQSKGFWSGRKEGVTEGVDEVDVDGASDGRFVFSTVLHVGDNDNVGLFVVGERDSTGLEVMGLVVVGGSVGSGS